MNVILFYIHLKCVALFNRFCVIDWKDLCFILQKSHLTCARRVRACACELWDIKVKRQKIERNSITYQAKNEREEPMGVCQFNVPHSTANQWVFTHTLLFLNKPRTATARKLHYSSISFWLNIFLPHIYQPCV